jgi:hypothetical protein
LDLIFLFFISDLSNVVEWSFLLDVQLFLRLCYLVVVVAVPTAVRSVAATVPTAVRSVAATVPTAVIVVVMVMVMVMVANVAGIAAIADDATITALADDATICKCLVYNYSI